MSFSSASILPRGFHNGELYYYLAVERNGTLSTFGGSREVKDGTHPQKTAAREMDEESKGVFASRDRIKKILSDWKNTGTKRVENGSHVCYIANFDMANHNPKSDYSKIHTNGDEILEIKPIKQADFRNMIDNDHWNYQGHAMRPCARKTMKIARNLGFI